MLYFKPNADDACEIVPGYVAQVFHSATMTCVHWAIEPGHQLPLHTHPHEQVVNMIEGRFALTVDGETRVLEAGDVVVIPSNVPHGGVGETPCRIIDVFHPNRDEYAATCS